MNRQKIYDGVASHIATFKTNEVGGEYTLIERVNEVLAMQVEIDAYLDTLELPDNESEKLTAISDSELTDNYLMSIKNTDATEFEAKRRLPFNELLSLAKA